LVDAQLDGEGKDRRDGLLRAIQVAERHTGGGKVQPRQRFVAVGTGDCRSRFIAGNGVQRVPLSLVRLV
jgi:hypothetical protein